MSDDEDLELHALQRQLDDAFQTTRPRAGFEDHLWAELQVRRPLLQRVRAALAGLVGGVRRVPAAPAAAVAVLLVVVIGVGLLSQGGFHFGGGGSTASLATRDNSGAGAQSYKSGGPFGLVPAPTAPDASHNTTVTTPESPRANLYAGPVQLVWAGRLSIPVSSAPVYRFSEPTVFEADKFATAVAASRQNGTLGPQELGQYAGDGFTLTVSASTPNLREPFYTFNVDPSSLPSQGPSAGGTADAFLSAHRLTPAWPDKIAVDQSGNVVYVNYLRQFAVPGYAFVYLVDPSGTRYGLQVQLQGGRPVMATGPLPVSLESADYRIISADRAAQSAVASSRASAGSTTLPTVRLTAGELVYELVWAGDHSFYEPAFLFSGTFNDNGKTYTKRVVVPALDPSQLSS